MAYIGAHSITASNGWSRSNYIHLGDDSVINNIRLDKIRLDGRVLSCDSYGPMVVRCD